MKARVSKVPGSEEEVSLLKEQLQLFQIRVNSLQEVLELQESVVLKRKNDASVAGDLVSRWRKKVHELLLQRNVERLEHEQSKRASDSRIAALTKDFTEKRRSEELLLKMNEDLRAEVELQKSKTRLFKVQCGKLEHTVTTLQQQVENLAEKTNAARDARTAATDDLHDMQNVSAQRLRALQRQQEAVNELQQKIQSSEAVFAENESLRREIHAARAEVAALRTHEPQVAKLNAKISRLRTQLREVERARAADSGMISQLTTSTASLLQLLQAAEANSDAAVAERNALKDQLAAATDAARAHSAELAETRAALSAATREAAQASDRSRAADAHVAALTEKLRVARADRAGLLTLLRPQSCDPNDGASSYGGSDEPAEHPLDARCVAAAPPSPLRSGPHGRAQPQPPHSPASPATHKLRAPPRVPFELYDSLQFPPAAALPVRADHPPTSLQRHTQQPKDAPPPHLTQSSPPPRCYRQTLQARVKALQKMSAHLLRERGVP
eukprot:gnl/Spiro4/15044_TR8108_c0_g2_i1.p1 gnl/Spiro4/15044_TR8108_c0_g2~~gnl/Spiro4/15044_TR8108_c0_g2_i1.p1  ORF type:complete len:508 (-),score=152.68 gnl/Spiro4/15044_TR8108_c0_g2_i1:24-1523(-)